MTVYLLIRRMCQRRVVSPSRVELLVGIFKTGSAAQKEADLQDRNERLKKAAEFLGYDVMQHIVLPVMVRET